MDALFTILFFVVAAVISAMVKKRRTQEQEEEIDDWSPPPSKEAGTQTSSSGSWEDELRKLLEGTGTPAPPPPPPPPIVTRESRPTKPAPTPPPVPVPSRFKAVTSKPVSKPASRTKAPTAKEAYERARTLDQQAKAHLQRAANMARRHSKTAPTSAPTDEIATARRLLKSPASIRSALIASYILGKPRALDPYN